ncbi:LPS export ABC transporter periplasmic protein LptC [bacterium]|nr:LPS export ABC transporter periplasmic protein LptC [bacterium]MBU2461517.1 LPS export ABC transporter periplasmic protein LptC [bacterium]
MKWLLLFLILEAGCQKEAKKIESPSPGFHKTVLTSSKGGEKVWKLMCDNVRMEEEMTHLSKIVLLLYKDKNICKITADSGILDQKNGIIELFSNVEATGADKIKLQTEKLTWNEKERSLATESEVIFQKEGLILSGRGFIAETDFSSMKIKNGVRVRFK